MLRQKQRAFQVGLECLSAIYEEANALAKIQGKRPTPTFSEKNVEDLKQLNFNYHWKRVVKINNNVGSNLYFNKLRNYSTEFPYSTAVHKP